MALDQAHTKDEPVLETLANWAAESSAEWPELARERAAQAEGGHQAEAAVMAAAARAVAAVAAAAVPGLAAAAAAALAAVADPSLS